MVAATVSPNTKDFLHQRQGATDSVFDFYKQEIFTYPLSNKFHLICLPVSNLSSSQSVVRCDDDKQMDGNITRLWHDVGGISKVVHLCVSKVIHNMN